MKHKVLAVIGAGEAAIPIIKKAKEMQIQTVAFGEADSLAKEKADVFVEQSVFDIDSIYQDCIRLNVSGVIASSEITTETAAVIADKLSIPGNRVREGFYGRNKYLMRRKLSGLKSIKQPSFCIYNGQEISDYPVVVKSVDSCGKKGVSLVNNEAELKKAVEAAQKYSSDGKALLEEYIEGGQEFSIECLASGDICTVVQITQKETSGPPHFAETGHHQPAQIPDKTRDRIEKCTKEILRELGIICGMAHLELKVRDDDIFFIEVGARAGGDHIADTLTVLSTDCDYYKAAIECSFGIYQPKPIHNRAYSGIYFHCIQNEKYIPLFEIAKSAPWCVENTVKESSLPRISSNCEAADAGYFIYSADHKIGLDDVNQTQCFKAVRINEYPNAFELIWNHNKEIGRTITDEELKSGIEKFLHNGNVIAVLDGEHIIAFLILYCNNYETLDAYICNVFVLEKFRGIGLSKKVVEKAIEICSNNSFQRIRLHVTEDNITAISLYKKYGFEFTGEIKMTEEKQLEMVLTL